MPFVTPAIFSRSLALPIALAQTELRRGKQVQIMQFNLQAGQLLELRCLNLHLIKVLTPGVIPQYVNRSLGLCSVGVYEGTMLTGAGALVKGLQVGVSQFNQWQVRRFISPGTYQVVVSNNAQNIDLSVAVTGTLKVYTA
jgi:hypothetical protein